MKISSFIVFILTLGYINQIYRTLFYETSRTSRTELSEYEIELNKLYRVNCWNSYQYKIEKRTEVDLKIKRIIVKCI